ncbi:MAG TPA: GNAT family N-acetyltransferase [Thermomicrobiales bacterium]|nr:GNAT family N-acetyltransferase [Thermomicrobiales bacterium]
MNEDVRISVLESPRLRLRPLRPDDAEALTAQLQDPAIARWTNSIPWPYSIDDARAFLSTRAVADANGESFSWAIVEKATGQLTGTIGLHDVHHDRGRAELGYWIGESFRGQGYTTEAAKRVLSWAFEVVGFERIQATYMPGNDASASVMRNIGMQPEGLLRGFGFKNGEHLDLYLQAVLKGDSTWASTDEQWAST